jgi:hypothetical protein
VAQQDSSPALALTPVLALAALALTGPEGNADHSGLVTRQTRAIGDGKVIDFAPFDKEPQ